MERFSRNAKQLNLFCLRDRFCERLIDNTTVPWFSIRRGCYTNILHVSQDATFLWYWYHSLFFKHSWKLIVKRSTEKKNKILSKGFKDRISFKSYFRYLFIVYRECNLAAKNNLQLQKARFQRVINKLLQTCSSEWQNEMCWKKKILLSLPSPTNTIYKRYVNTLYMLERERKGKEEREHDV